MISKNTLNDLAKALDQPELWDYTAATLTTENGKKIELVYNYATNSWEIKK